MLNERELKSRYEVYKEIYDETITFEGRCALTIAKTQIAPAAVTYQSDLAKTIKSVEVAGLTGFKSTKDLLTDVCSETEGLLKTIKELEKCVDGGDTNKILMAMESLRVSADNLEGLIPDHLWPLPSYAEMMFKI